MPEKSKKILVLFCGGENLGTDFGAEDLAKLMTSFPELQIVAQVDAEFFYYGPSADMPQEIWAKLAQRIHETYQDYDGFAITFGVDNVLLAANLLNFMLRPLNKPVIFTGSPLTDLRHLRQAQNKLTNLFHYYGPTSLYTNLINAVQAASLALPGISLAYGSNIVKAVRAQMSFSSDMEIFSAWQMPQSGDINFGVNLNLAESVQREQVPELAAQFASNIKIVDLYAHQPETLEINDCAGVVVRGYLEKVIPEQLKIKTSAPILVYTQGDIKEEGNYIKAKGYTFEAALAKFMWALGQTRDINKLREYFKTDLIGEIVK